jgi:hypothetical protein
MSEETTWKRNSRFEDNIKISLKVREIQKMKFNPNSSGYDLLMDFNRHG